LTVPAPKVVFVGPKTYAIEVSAEQTAKQDAEAVCFAKHEQIYLAPDLAPGTERVAVLHELVHACFDDAAVGGVLDKEDDEEKVCLALAPRLLDVLRRNPKLVTYLTT
jgi:Zn-dependent peptidase ImmA (M78 family)